MPTDADGVCPEVVELSNRKAHEDTCVYAAGGGHSVA